MTYLKKVKEAMKKNVVALRKDDKARKAAELIGSSKIGCVIIEDEEKNPIGIVTERDLVSKIIGRGLNPDIPLEEVMTSPILTISWKANLSDAARKMTYNDIKRIPVTKETGQLVGIITISDILRETLIDPNLSKTAALEYLQTALNVVHLVPS